MAMAFDREAILAMLREGIGKPFAINPSPVGRWLDGTLEELHGDGATVSYLVRDEWCNPSGALHGGIAATMLDDLTGATVIVLTGRYFASVDLHIDYLAPARAGDRVYARSTLVRQGKRLVHVEGALRHAGGELIAKCTGNLIVVGE